jgi:3-oxoacyl-[acyl-carrier protein] reductase
MNLKGKVVLVTGASRGIGRALARSFAADGANVPIFARSAQELQETTQSDTEHFLAVVGDSTAEADVDRIVDAVRQCFGRVDAIVCYEPAQEVIASELNRITILRGTLTDGRG